MLLLNERVILLLTGIDLAVSKDLVSCVLLFDWLNLPFFHMVVNDHFLLLEVHCHLGDLFLRWLQLAPLPLLTHLQDPHLVNVVVVVVINLSRVDAVRLVLDEGDSPACHFVVSVFIELSRLFSNLLDALDESIVVPVGVVSNDSHPAIDLYHLLPVWHLPWPVVLDSLELVGVAVSPLQFIASVLEEVSDLLDYQLLVVLNNPQPTS